MTDNGSAEALKKHADRIRGLLSQQIALSADFAELRKEVNGDGFDYSDLKAVTKADLLDADDGKGRVAKLREKAGNLSLYLDVVAPEQKQEAA